ncbi:hypothetical protein [Novosphingobium sp. FSW06-99]|uniref:hypothetical protein n=1 Tax=Novosphingobium sp. FSW06-99 TaxID=1739113 RepID=UPI00076BF808|nr:hypothetical protein [Novosphingobium sp. FSW06-99]KUR80556.1 hypothetical protein AQZ49_00400 [Novosphingobium sp. FSW06-99]
MTTPSLEHELDRIALALDRLERAATARELEIAEMSALKARHRRLKDTVSNELQQLDLLLANLPQKP